MHMRTNSLSMTVSANGTVYRYLQKGNGAKITSPKHGDSGWYQGRLVIFDAGLYGAIGWYFLRNYQVNKATTTGKSDWRIRSAEDYARSSFGQTSLFSPPSPAGRVSTPRPGHWWNDDMSAPPVIPGKQTTQPTNVRVPGRRTPLTFW